MVKSQRRTHASTLAISLIGLFGVRVALAEENWQWGGFLSQSAVYSSDNNYFGATDDRVSGAFGETGVIAHGMVWDKFEFAGQAIARRAGDSAVGTPRFDYLNLTYRFNENMDSSQGLRVGKLKGTIGFYNETREVPFTRPSIFLPQGIYWEKTRNSRSFYDGAQYFYEYRGDMHAFNVRVGGGAVKADQREFDLMMGIENAIAMDSISTRQFALAHDYDGGRIRTSFTSVSLQADLTPKGMIRAISSRTGKLDYDFDVVSMEYNSADWSLTGEYMRGKTTTGFNGVLFATITEHPETSYLQFTYRLSEKLEYFARYESQLGDRYDPNGTGFIKEAFTPLLPYLPLFDVEVSPAHSRYSYDKVIGVAWRPSSDLMLRAEWHHMIGTAAVANYLFNKDKLTKEWDLLAIQLSYRFN